MWVRTRWRQLLVDGNAYAVDLPAGQTSNALLATSVVCKPVEAARDSFSDGLETLLSEEVREQELAKQQGSMHCTGMVQPASACGCSFNIYTIWGDGAVAGGVAAGTLSLCSCASAAALRASCRTLALGSKDGGGRFFTGSVRLAGAQAPLLLRRVAPGLLVHLQLLHVGAAGCAAALGKAAPELLALRRLTIRLSAPQLLRSTGESREGRAAGALGAVRTLAHAIKSCGVGSGLHTLRQDRFFGLRALEIDLRGGCLVMGDTALEELAPGFPPSLTLLHVDASNFTARGARAVAAAMPQQLLDLRLFFHGRSFVWFGALGSEDSGLSALATALPAGLRRLYLALECGMEGATVLCGSLPSSLQELDLNLQVLTRPRGAPTLAVAETGGLPGPSHGLAEALAKALPRRLAALRLRLGDCSLGLDGVGMLARAMPQRLADLRLDLSGREVGDEGARALAATLPRGLTRLALCLRGWRLTEEGAEALAGAVGARSHLRRLKLVISGAPIGARGAGALATAVPPRLERLNLSLRLCGVGANGERALRPLARRWGSLPGSWIRVRDRSTPISHSVEDGAEWELWDD